MRTNPLLVAASIACGVPGLLLLFGADEVLVRAGAPAVPMATWMVGLLGGTLVALALMNWFQRHSLLGGIYGRPLVIANTLVFTNACFSSLRMWRTTGGMVYASATVVSALLMVAFARTFFVNPAAVSAPPAGTP